MKVGFEGAVKRIADL